MFMLQNDDAVLRTRCHVSPDILVCTPLGIQPGIVRQTREKFSSDTDCSSVLANGVTISPVLGGSANARLKSTYEGALTNATQSVSRLNTPGRFYRRFPLPNNGLEKVYSSESNIHEAAKHQYFRWEQPNCDRNPMDCVPNSQDERNAVSSVDFNYASPCSPVSGTKNIPENHFPSASSKDTTKVDNRRCFSNSESPTGSYLDRQNSRNRPPSFGRDQQNFQPPLVTTGQRGFGVVYSVHSSSQEPQINETSGQREVDKIDQKSVSERQPQDTISKVVKASRVSSWAAFPKEHHEGNKLRDFSQNNNKITEPVDLRMGEGKGTAKMGNTESFIFKDHTPFSYITSQSLISRQLSLLKPQSGSVSNRKRQSFTTENQNLENIGQLNPMMSDSLAPSSSSAENAKNKSDPCSPKKTTARDSSIVSCLKPYILSDNYEFGPTADTQVTGSWCDEVKIGCQVDKHNGHQKCEKPSFSEAERLRNQLSITEHRNPNLMVGSEVLSYVWNSSVNLKQMSPIPKRVNRIGQYNNFKTFPGPNPRDKVSVDDQLSLGHNKAVWPSHYNGPMQMDDKSEVKGKTEKENSAQQKADEDNGISTDTNKKSQRFGRSLSNLEPRMATLFKSSMKGNFAAQKIFIPKESEEKRNMLGKFDESHQSPTRKNMIENPVGSSKREDIIDSSKLEEPQLTAKQITDILEKTLKFRLQPPGAESRTSGTTASQKLNQKEEKQQKIRHQPDNDSSRLSSTNGEINGLKAPQNNDQSNLRSGGQPCHKKDEVKFTRKNQPTNTFDLQPVAEKAITKELCEKLNQQTTGFTTPSLKSQATLNVKGCTQQKKNHFNYFLKTHSINQQTLIPPEPSSDRKPADKMLANTICTEADIKPGNVESMPAPYTPPTFSSIWGATKDTSLSSPSDIRQSTMGLTTTPSSDKNFRQTSNQRITERPDFNLIAQKLERQFKRGANLTRSQSSTLPFTDVVKTQENAAIVKSITELDNNNEKVSEETPVIKSDTRPRSLSGLEDESLTPVRMKLFKELTETLARRSGNFEEGTSPSKQQEQQAYRSILRPKSTEKSEQQAPKPRISFPPDDKLTVTHDYEADLERTKMDSDSDGSTSEDDTKNSHSFTDSTRSAEETEDPTAADASMIRLRRKSFPRPRWSDKENITENEKLNGFEDGSSHRFPRLTASGIPTGTFPIPDQPPSPHRYLRGENLEKMPVETSLTQWKSYQTLIS
ncbi:hypothetical protein FGIG_10010 [Fasciola gigantica]|uniref:Uncharacterized protein n=1 Tax=Fasciola gigantica TaxID=46835 RepID=A0A504YFZ7_FASGI|nr:hypothetical protein FGIG_10010 [Fasciola gigantica]